MRPFVFVALILIAGISHAAAGTDEIPSVSFPRFPLEIGRTHFYPASGTPAAQAELNTPSPNDFPPSLTIGLETGKEADGGGRFIILGRNYLRVYNLREVKTAPFKTIQAQITQLEKLLKRRPTRTATARQASTDQLPDYPPRNAGHLIEAKLSYVDAEWGSGVCYLTQFVQGMGETPNNQQLTYLFQGIDKKKTLYVAADFQISHGDVAASPEEDSLDWRIPAQKEAAEAICRKIERLLDRAPDESFTPSLKAIKEWLKNIELKG